MPRLQMSVHGRVQGVGFRAFVRRVAETHGVAGTVRNRPDGAVEIDAEAGTPALEAFAEEVRRGPMHARVEHVVERRGDPTGRHRSFRIVG